MPHKPYVRPPVPFISCQEVGAFVDTDARLRREIDTWRGRLDAALEEAKPLTEDGDDFLENVQAYRADTDHFEKEEDLVRAFEAIVWAWSWLEIGARIDAIDWEYPDDGFPPTHDA